MANLAQIIPALFIGPGGQQLTQEQIRERQQMAQDLLAQATDTSPNAGGVASILAKGVSGFRAGMDRNAADNALKANAGTNQSLIAGLVGGLGGTGGLGQTATAATPTVAPMQNVAPASIPQTADAAMIRQGLVDRGLPSHVADAFVVNFKDESGLNPGINEANPVVPGSRGGFGLYQLTGPRRTAYESFAAQRGVDPSDVDAQLDFLKYELDGPEAKAAQSILSAPDTSTAAQAIVNNFLRPSEEHRTRRAASYANLGGQPTAPSDNGIEAAMASSTRSAFPPAPSAQSASSGVNPAIIAALSNPVANEQTRSVAAALLNNQLSQQQAAQELALKQQQQQQAIAQRQSIAQTIGVNPSAALDDSAWKSAVDAANRGRQTVTVGNNVYDLANPSQPIITGAPEKLPLMNLGDGTVYDPNAPADQRFIQAPNATGKVPDSVRALEIRAERAGLQPGTPEYNQFMISGGNGGTTLSVSPDGSVQFSQGGSGKSLTEAQSKDAFFAARMTSAMPTLDKYEKSLMSLPEAAAGSLPAGRYLQSEEYQLARDAGDDFVATYLRKDSGAALTKEERTEYGNMLLPQPGDKPAIIEAKRIRRQVAARAIQLGLPQTAVDNMVKAVGEVDGAGTPVPTTNQSQPAQGWKDLGNGVKIRPKGSS